MAMTYADTVGGFIIVPPLGIGIYRGWVGGIVSVDAKHASRLRRRTPAIYYLVTLLLQVSGFVLASGAGLHLGWANLRHQGPFIGPRWLRLPKTALQDVGWLYLVIVPIFAAGSLFEYLMQA